MTSSTTSQIHSGHFDPEEIKRLVNVGKERGLISEGGKARPVEKDFDPATQGEGLRSEWVDITPELALRWLANNFGNRKVSEDLVKAYARDMKNGEWQATHQGIAFNDKDELIDGQHRLMAIARSGCVIRTMVTFGLPSKIKGKEMTTMDCVDRGRPRSIADQLKIQHGMKNGGIIASICMNIARLCFQQRTRRLSVGQTLEIYRAFEPEIQAIIKRRSKEHGLKAAGVLAAFVFAVATDKRLLTMFERLNSGADLIDQSPMFHLRAFLTSDDAKLLSRSSDRALAELVLQAIHLEIHGDTIDQLELGTDGVAKYRNLQPERVEMIVDLFKLPED